MNCPRTGTKCVIPACTGNNFVCLANLNEMHNFAFKMSKLNQEIEDIKIKRGKIEIIQTGNVNIKNAKNFDEKDVLDYFKNELKKALKKQKGLNDNEIEICYLNTKLHFKLL